MPFGSFSWLFWISFFLLTLNLTYGYKPVIIMHGLLDEAKNLDDLVKLIEKAHPGTVVHNIDLFESTSSLEEMWKQLEVIGNLTKNIMASAKDGVHLIGYSQGGLLSRGIVQTTDNHNVRNFIALSSPMNGQFGDTSYVNKFFPGHLKEDLYKIFYNKWGQLFSIANYWKDPHEIELYHQYSAFLAKLNNESNSESFQYPQSWKTNFERLENLVLIGGPDDGVITPWQSAHFECYNFNETVVPLKYLKIYQDDTFGLRTLDRKGRLHRYTVPGVKHVLWHGNETVFMECIERWLT